MYVGAASPQMSLNFVPSSNRFQPPERSFCEQYIDGITARLVQLTYKWVDWNICLRVVQEKARIRCGFSSFVTPSTSAAPLSLHLTWRLVTNKLFDIPHGGTFPLCTFLFARQSKLYTSLWQDEKMLEKFLRYSSRKGKFLSWFWPFSRWLSTVFFLLPSSSSLNFHFTAAKVMREEWKIHRTHMESVKSNFPLFKLIFIAWAENVKLFNDCVTNVSLEVAWTLTSISSFSKFSVFFWLEVKSFLKEVLQFSENWIFQTSFPLWNLAERRTYLKHV